MTDVAGTSAVAAPAGARVLIAEDEQHLGMLLEQFLVARGHRVARVRDGREAIARLRAESYDVALVDVNMPGADGLDVLRVARALPLPPEVAVVTGHGTVDTALEAMRLGAYDYLTKPYRMAEVEAIVRRMHEKRTLARAVAACRASAARERGAEFVTQFAPLRAVLALVDRAALGDAPVLIQGEPGTGKALLARRAHERSGRDDLSFAAVDCRAVARNPDTTATLLGDGDSTRPGGVLAAAEWGTLLLAHVDALSLATQQRLGELLGRQMADGRARVVATTERDLAALAQRKRFDTALLDHLSATSVVLPPLRDRRTDVGPLVEHFVHATCDAADVHVVPPAVAALEAYHWPGNVTELRAVVVAGAARARAGDGVLDVDALRLRAPDQPTGG